MIRRTSEYALRAAVALAGSSGRSMLCPELAHLTHVRPAYLRKVLQTLVRGDLVESRPGPGGGFALAKPPAKITVLEVIESVEPIRRIESCPLGRSTHAAGLCPLHRRLDEAVASIRSAFGRTTLEELAPTGGEATTLCEPPKRKP